MIQGGTGPEKGKGGAQAREREGRHLRQIWGGTMISPTIGHMYKLGGAGERFGDEFFLDCINLPCISGCNQFKNTIFTIPNTYISTYNRNMRGGRENGISEGGC